MIIPNVILHSWFQANPGNPFCTRLTFGTGVLHLIQKNHEPDAKIFSLLSWRLFTAQHVSGVFLPIIRSTTIAVAASGFTFVSWWQSCCVRGRSGRPARPRTQHDCHHNTKVKSEAATAVIELLLMGGKTPETCWVVNKRLDNKLKNYCIRLVICLN
jgi:hypothetical protein